MSSRPPVSSIRAKSAQSWLLMSVGRDGRARRSPHFDYEHEQEHEREHEQEQGSHAHYLVTAIDVNHLAGDGCGSVAGEENSRGAQLGGIATAFQRCAFLIMFKHRAEPADAPGADRLHRPPRNACSPD